MTQILADEEPPHDLRPSAEPFHLGSLKALLSMKTPWNHEVHEGTFSVSPFFVSFVSFVVDSIGDHRLP